MKMINKHTLHIMIGIAAVAGAFYLVKQYKAKQVANMNPHKDIQSKLAAVSPTQPPKDIINL